MKTINLYSKTAGCPQCSFTKRKLIGEGIAAERSGELVSTIEGLEIKTTYIDQPENADTLEQLKLEGFASAPVVQLNFPVADSDGEFDTFAGFQPEKIKAIKKALEGNK